MRPNKKSTHNSVCCCVRGAWIALCVDIPKKGHYGKKYIKLPYHKHAPKLQKVHTMVSGVVYRVLRLCFVCLFAQPL